MDNSAIEGPYRILEVPGGTPVPWYMLPFDAAGLCTGPVTRSQLVSEVANGDYTDVFLFSHGWNNTWDNATSSYAAFMTGYAGMVRDRGLVYPRPFHPLLVGIYWPSIEFIRADELPPQVRDLEATNGGEPDLAIAQERPPLAFVAAGVPAAHRQQFSALAERDRLTGAEALEMARLLLPTYQEKASGPREIPSAGGAITAEALVEMWRQTLSPAPPDDETQDEGEAARVAGDRGLMANVLSFDPRDILRAVTLLKMKDRAGVVGAQGVGPLLADLLAANPAARLHLLGHSYGCRVMLSALCAQPLSRKVNSALLLQPAVSCFCFAGDVLGTGQPGGFREAMARVEQAILATFSRRDLPLHDFFHLAVRRPGDVGEVGGDRGLESPPDSHAALGGYGPVGCAGECDDMAMPGPGAGYSLPDGVRVVGLDGSTYISGHSDISNEATWWALYNQVTR